MRSFHQSYHFLTLITLLFALGVVVLGAYVRLTDAGLGCPDWPGCFGELLAPLTEAEQQAASAAFPGSEVDALKAWREMVHRYAAGILGGMILLLALLSFFQGARSLGAAITSWLLVMMVVFQAWLGKLTVDYLLQPEIVVGHLMGGMIILALLRWLNLQANPDIAQPSRLIGGWRWLAMLGVVALAGQIFLGGWTSANYAQFGCPDFPLCQGKVIPQADFATGFDFSLDSNIEQTNYEGGILDHPARVAIHYVHRLGAVVTTFILLIMVYAGRKQQHVPMLRRVSLWLLAFLIAQLAIAVVMITNLIPLHLAVAHNAVAALLWLTAITYLFVVWCRCK